jgi:hypothetical protein
MYQLSIELDCDKMESVIDICKGLKNNEVG